jgi:hypothetical protein
MNQILRCAQNDEGARSTSYDSLFWLAPVENDDSEEVPGPPDTAFPDTCEATWPLGCAD